MTEQTTKRLEVALRELRESYYQRVLSDLRTSQDSYAAIGSRNGVGVGVVYLLARQHGLSRSRANIGAQGAGETSVEGGFDGTEL